jgi:hypothetical protein
VIHHNTVRDYIEFLADNYWTLVLYFWKRDADANALASDKKLYFPDPLLYVIARDHAPGLAHNEPAQVENAIAAALYRTYEHAAHQLTTWNAPRRLHAWETDKEIDFVCGPRSAVDVVEVKYQTNPDLRTAAGIGRAFPGRPVILATKDRLTFRERSRPYPRPCSSGRFGLRDRLPVPRGRGPLRRRPDLDAPPRARRRPRSTASRAAHTRGRLRARRRDPRRRQPRWLNSSPGGEELVGTDRLVDARARLDAGPRHRRQLGAGSRDGGAASCGFSGAAAARPR